MLLLQPFIRYAHIEFSVKTATAKGRIHNLKTLLPFRAHTCTMLKKLTIGKNMLEAPQKHLLSIFINLETKFCVNIKYFIFKILFNILSFKEPILIHNLTYLYKYHFHEPEIRGKLFLISIGHCYLKNRHNVKQMNYEIFNCEKVQNWYYLVDIMKN